MFNLVPRFLDATIRQFGFLLKGLREVEADLREKHIPFHLLSGAAVDNVPKFAKDNNAAAVVCDMSPLRVPMEWANEVASKLDAASIPLLQVRSWGGGGREGPRRLRRPRQTPQTLRIASPPPTLPISHPTLAGGRAQHCARVESVRQAGVCRADHPLKDHGAHEPVPRSLSRAAGQRVQLRAAQSCRLESDRGGAGSRPQRQGGAGLEPHAGGQRQGVVAAKTIFFSFFARSTPSSPATRRAWQPWTTLARSG